MSKLRVSLKKLMDVRRIISEEVQQAFKWLNVVQTGGTGRTKVYQVIAKQGNVLLGEVKWLARWRKYSFFPADGTIFESDCLKDIASFLDGLMRERKK